MELEPRNPTDGVYAATDDYVHAMEVRGAERLLFISGTMGLDPDGKPGATLAEQLDLIWSNLRAILASAGMTVDNIVRLTSYLRDPAYADANAAARVAALQGRRADHRDRGADAGQRVARRDRGRRRGLSGRRTVAEFRRAGIRGTRDELARLDTFALRGDPTCLRPWPFSAPTATPAASSSPNWCGAAGRRSCPVATKFGCANSRMHIPGRRSGPRPSMTPRRSIAPSRAVWP
ncbi:hypothetical protein NBRGN_082_00280 [Nocardia brasiliensis NBRC 14402]|nr:hypothetical protein NBRGN_082_00280 [Nocardia brasiliensis NBRC 14402]